MMNTAALMSILIILTQVGGWFSPVRQAINSWSSPERIPGYADETDPPILIADNNHTVHAFSSQWVGENKSYKAIIYNRWTPDYGWTMPVDIILPPLKREARLLDVTLDKSGFFHLIFFAGDETQASIYYTRSNSDQADYANSWEKPRQIGHDAFVFESGKIVGDGSDHLVVIYSGTAAGPGVYAMYSSNGGDEWSEPVALFLSGDPKMWPSGLDLFVGESGTLHAVWDLVNEGGQGRKIYYTNSQIDEKTWSTPRELASVESGLGVRSPRIIEHLGNLFVFYYSNGPMLMRFSHDLGNSWFPPTTQFRQIGFNGSVSFAVDSNDILHLLWGQRITGNPDIHGLWHSTWQQKGWNTAEPVTSGPRITDETQGKGFDPSNARAVVSQGNILLVTWNQDPQAGVNGVWYSFTRLDAPELPVSATPRSRPSPSATPTPALSSQILLMTSVPDLDIIGNITEDQSGGTSGWLSTSILLGLSPVALLLIGFLIIKLSRQFGRY